MKNVTQPSEVQSLFDQLVAAWPSPLVPRSKVREFSGGLLHPRTLANLDSKGEGPGKISFAGRVAYSREDLARWLVNRIRRAA
jgi:hypothetical protein